MGADSPGGFFPQWDCFDPDVYPVHFGGKMGVPKAVAGRFGRPTRVATALLSELEPPPEGATYLAPIR